MSVLRIGALALCLLALAIPGRAEVHGGGGPADPGRISPGGREVEAMRFPPLRWALPSVGVEVGRLVMDNGMVVYLLPDPSLPRIRASLMIRGGTDHEPLAQDGIAEIAADLLRSGGTGPHPPKDLDRLLEVGAISLETRVTRETTEIHLDALSGERARGLQLLAELARQPRWDEEKLAILKERVHESLRRQDDRPASIVAREFPHLLFGDHPYGRRLRWEAVERLDPEQLAAWHGAHFGPDRAFLALSGDFDPAEVEAELRRLFSDWRALGGGGPETPTLPDEPGGGVFLIDKDLTQSNVIVGHRGVARTDPERATLEVMNYILGGGGFSSRLTQAVRNRAGLAYSVRSVLDLSSARQGLFYANLQTRSESTRQALDLVLQEFARLRSEPISQGELAQAQEALVNQMVFHFDTPHETALRLMGLELLGMDPEEYRGYEARIRAVTADDVLRVARRVLVPERLVTLVVGKAAAVEGSLEGLGQIVRIPLTPVK